MVKRMSKTAKAAKLSQDRRFFEHQNLFLERNGKASTIAQVKRANVMQGYDAFRVSPQIISRNGKKYRKVYGAQIDRNYSARNGVEHKVNWYDNGVVRASVKSGTRMSDSSVADIVGNNPTGIEEKRLQSKLRNLLMIRKRRTSKR